MARLSPTQSSLAHFPLSSAKRTEKTTTTVGWNDIGEREGAVRFSFVVTLAGSIGHNPTSRSIIRSTDLSNAAFPASSFPMLDFGFMNRRTELCGERIVGVSTSSGFSLFHRRQGRFLPLLRKRNFEAIFIGILRFDLDGPGVRFGGRENLRWDATFGFECGDTFCGTVFRDEFVTNREFGGRSTRFGNARFGGRNTRAIDFATFLWRVGDHRWRRGLGFLEMNVEKFVFNRTLANRCDGRRR